MNLTQAQLQTLRTWLDANAVGLDDEQAAAALNATASPDYLAWRTSVNRHEIQTDPGYDWTRVDNLSVGKARIWDGMFNSGGTLPAYRGNYRTGINAVWVGTQADLDVRAAVLGVCRRKLTVGEKLFAVVTSTGPSQSGNRGSTTNPDTFGTDSNGNPLEGQISLANVSEARNLP